MLFTTNFLYKKAIQNYDIEVNAFGASQSLVFHNHYLNLMKSDQYSAHHIKVLKNSLKLSFKLLPYSRNLCRILKDYLMVGNYN
jgi:intergrase/recombinase